MYPFEMTNIDNTVFALFAASGKSSLSLAHNLTHGRPKGKSPCAVYAVGLATSKGFTEGTGLYDKVLLYDAHDSDLSTELSLKPITEVMVCDFGVRGGATDKWAQKLRESHNVVQVGVGSEPMAETPEQATAKFLDGKKALAGLKRNTNASVLRTQAMEILGEKEYFESFMKEWKQFKDQDGIKSPRLVRGQGINNVAKDWGKLYKGEVGADEGLVVKLKLSRAGASL